MTDHEKKMVSLRRDFLGCRTDSDGNNAYDRLEDYAETLEVEGGCAAESLVELSVLIVKQRSEIAELKSQIETLENDAEYAGYEADEL